VTTRLITCSPGPRAPRPCQRAGPPIKVQGSSSMPGTA
jgi:hypothetical protein